MNFSLRGKLFGLAGLLLALTLVLGIASITSLKSVGDKGGSMYRDRAVPLRDLGEARALLGGIDSQTLRSFTATGDTKAAVAEARADEARLNKLLKAYRATELVDAEKSALVAFDADWKTYRAAVPAAFKLGMAERNTDASVAYFGTIAPLYAKVDADLANLIGVNDRVAKQINADIQATNGSSRKLTITLMSVSFVPSFSPLRVRRFRAKKIPSDAPPAPTQS